jgi:hypothetical protein
MSEYTEGELKMFYQDGKLYLECDAPSGIVRLAEMTMGHRNDSIADAEEIINRWNAFEKDFRVDLVANAEKTKQQRDDLLEAVKYLMGDKSSDVIAHRLTLTGTKVQRIIAIVAAIANCKPQK